jgi:hypothetical protein
MALLVKVSWDMIWLLIKLDDEVETFPFVQKLSSREVVILEERFEFLFDVLELIEVWLRFDLAQLDALLHVGLPVVDEEQEQGLLGNQAGV